MFTVTTAKLTGIPGKNGWSQVYEFSPEDTEKLNTRGKLYMVVATNHSQDGVDTLSSGRNLFSKFYDDYYSKSSEDVFSLIKKTAGKINNEFSQIWGNVELVVFVELGNLVYSLAMGGGNVMVLRDGFLVKILESKKEETITASGHIKVGDTFLLATNSFVTKFPLGIIKASLSAPTPTEGVENLNPLIHDGHEIGSLGAEIIRFDEQVVVSEEIINKTPTGLEVEFQKVSIPIQAKIKSVLSNVLHLIPRKSIYVKQNLTDEVSPQSKKATFSIAIILLILLFVSIGFGIRQKKITDERNKYLGILQEAENEVDQAISLASVSSDRSRQLFLDAQQKIATIDGLNIKDEAFTKLKQKINESRAAILGEYLVEPVMFLDLSLLSSGFKGDTVSFSGGEIYVMDTAGKRIVSVNAETKKSKVVAGPSVISTVESMAAYEGKVFILGSDGIYKVDSGNEKVIAKSWSGEAIITAFAGNIYVLDKSGNSIYRYQGVNNSFADKQNWLAGGTNVNFANVSQISVDGSIYALFPNSKILRFSQGSPLNFNITGVIPQIGNIDAINASPDNQDIYLLDKAGKRIVVTDKKGIYKSQYVSDSISAATNLVVSEKDNKIILLTGDKLYSIDLAN